MKWSDETQGQKRQIGTMYFRGWETRFQEARNSSFSKNQFWRWKLTASVEYWQRTKHIEIAFHGKDVRLIVSTGYPNIDLMDEIIFYIAVVVDHPMYLRATGPPFKVNKWNVGVQAIHIFCNVSVNRVKFIETNY